VSQSSAQERSGADNPPSENSLHDSLDVTLQPSSGAVGSYESNKDESAQVSRDLQRQRTNDANATINALQSLNYAPAIQKIPRKLSSPGLSNGTGVSPTNPSYVTAFFGPLPNGIGTPAQRAFWAQKCENRPNDGSMAAQGCQQSRQSLNVSPAPTPAKMTTAGLTKGGGNPGYLSSGSSTRASQAATQIHCISMREAPGTGGGVWQVVNACSFSVVGNFCYADSSAMGCVNHGGGFGTIPAGGTAGVSPPNKSNGAPIQYFTHVCKADEWDSGICVLQKF